MHNLLKRQLKKFLGEQQITTPEHQAFLNAVDAEYQQFDADRKMLERSLELSSDELFKANSEMRAVFQASPDLLFWLDKSGTILDCKGGKIDDLQFPRERLIGKNIQNAHLNLKKNMVAECLAQVVSEKKMLSLEYAIRIQEQQKYYEARLVPMPSERIIMIVRNITERATAQEERERLIKRLAQSEKMSALGQLAGGIAHEINNPLGVILGFAQSLRRRISPSNPFFPAVDAIQREAHRCKHLVQDLLVFSRMEKSEKELCQLNDVVAGALSLVEAQSKTSFLNLVKEFAPDLPALSINRTQIQQVIINLCSNSMDAMSEGGTLRIGTRQLLKNGKYFQEISVQDSGTGIAKEIQSKIFEPFFTTKDVGKGTGLGLSLVYEIVKKHQGEVALQSAPNQGTVFHILLPTE